MSMWVDQMLAAVFPFYPLDNQWLDSLRSFRTRPESRLQVLRRRVGGAGTEEEEGRTAPTKQGEGSSGGCREQCHHSTTIATNTIYRSAEYPRPPYPTPTTGHMCISNQQCGPGPSPGRHHGLRHERGGARLARAQQADREEPEGGWDTGSQGHQAPSLG